MTEHQKLVKPGDVLQTIDGQLNNLNNNPLIRLGLRVLSVNELGVLAI